MSIQLSAEEIRDLLVPTHLYYDVGAQSLKTRAFAEILTKILYLKYEKKARFAELSTDTAKVVCVPQVANPDIVAGLGFLRNQGIVRKGGKHWILTEDGINRVERDLAAARDRIDHILDKHFGTRLDRVALTRWFKAAAAVFFSEYGEVWAQRLKRQPSSIPTITVLSRKLSDTVEQFGLQEESESLVRGFHSFLGDYGDPLVDHQVWSFAQAMLSAKLVSASVGPDPLSISEFKNARLFLDTNVLFLAALEKSRFSKALVALAACVKDIGTTFHIIYATRKEYEAVVARKRAETLRVVESYPIDVVAEAADLFTLTGLARGCATSADFDTFFSSIQDVPKSIEDQDILLEDEPQIAEAAERGATDTKKQKEILTEWKRHHPYPKGKNSAKHDASLEAVVNLMRKRKEKAWVLTADRSMQTLSARWHGNELPAWIGLDTLIQVLAVSGSGPSHKPENFAPLLSTLIREDIHPSDRAFSIEDLDSLLDLEERVKELSKEEIQQFATKMARLRLTGRSKTDSELQLEIRRTFQRKKMTTDEQTRALENEARVAREDLRRENVVRQVTAEALRKELERKRRYKEYVPFALKFLLVLAFGGLIMTSGAHFWSTGSTNVGLLLVGIGITEIVLPAFLWIIPGFKTARSKARKWAEKEVERLIEQTKRD